MTRTTALTTHQQPYTCVKLRTSEVTILPTTTGQCSPWIHA